MGKWMKGLIGMKQNLHRNHRNATSITSKYVCWKCHETWCAVRRMIVLTVQAGGRSMSIVMTRKRGLCCRIVCFSDFGWKAAVLLSMRVCQWQVAHFQHGFITKVDGIKYVVRNGTDTFSIFCLPNQRWCGTSVPIGFGPWGNSRMAWGNAVCHWDGVTSGCLG